MLFSHTKKTEIVHWPVIDVTKRSVEETAATIVQYLKKHQEKLADGEN